MSFASNMQPPEKINSKGALFVRMLVFEKFNASCVVSISLNNYRPLVNWKNEKYTSLLGTFQPNFEQLHASNKYISAENEIGKHNFIEQKASINNYKY